MKRDERDWLNVRTNSVIDERIDSGQCLPNGLKARMALLLTSSGQSARVRQLKDLAYKSFRKVGFQWGSDIVEDSLRTDQDLLAI